MNIYEEFECFSELYGNKLILDSFTLNGNYARLSLNCEGNILGNVVLEEKQIDILIKKLQEIKGDK